MAQAAGYACGCDLIAPAKKACFSVLARPVQAAFFAQKSGRANRHSTGRFSAGCPAPRGLRCRRAGFFPQWRRDIRRMRHSVQGRAPRRMCAWRTLRRASCRCAPLPRAAAWNTGHAAQLNPQYAMCGCVIGGLLFCAGPHGAALGLYYSTFEEAQGAKLCGPARWRCAGCFFARRCAALPVGGVRRRWKGRCRGNTRRGFPGMSFPSVPWRARRIGSCLRRGRIPWW